MPRSSGNCPGMGSGSGHSSGTAGPASASSARI
jgi:hypothetical protein